MNWRILIALNDNPLAVDEPLAIHAADVGIELARMLNGELGFVYVIGDPSEIGADSGVSAEDAIETAKEDAKELIAAIRQRAPELAVLEFMPIGCAALEIIKVAREWPASLIVLRGKARTGIPRPTFGSVAESVMQHARCPVMVVKRTE
jgi:nucleotide-binding universal stress UspA family protein